MSRIDLFPAARRLDNERYFFFSPFSPLSLFSALGLASASAPSSPSTSFLPFLMTSGSAGVAVFRREDVRDCLISASGSTLATLRKGARIGTGSLRRQSQLRHIRPDLDVRDLRGNVDTRLRKAQSGEYDAILLAKAGLDRLGWSDRITETFAPDIFLPAVGQGAIAAECRLSDNEAAEVLTTLDDAESRSAIIAP